MASIMRISFEEEFQVINENTAMKKSLRYLSILRAVPKARRKRMNILSSMMRSWKRASFLPATTVDYGNFVTDFFCI